MDILKIFEEAGVVPVIKLTDPAQALPLAEALRKGGLNCAEITFRTDAAAESIRRIHEAFPDMALAAGTVLTPEQVNAAAEAGAAAIVSPGLNPTVVQYCLDRGIPVCPGVCTPGEVEKGLSFGLNLLKFFPAEVSGGVPMVKALSAPYGNVRFMPTGGVKPANLRDYISQKAVFCCGGTWLAPQDLIDVGDFEKITENGKEAVAIVKEVRGK